MVGMDNAIKDIVSMVTILYDRKLASYDGRYSFLTTGFVYLYH